MEKEDLEIEALRAKAEERRRRQEEDLRRQEEEKARIEAEKKAKEVCRASFIYLFISFFILFQNERTGLNIRINLEETLS
jgi:hypothetical protein